MISTAAGAAAGPVGAAIGGTVDLATLLYKILNKNRHAENLKPNDAYGNGGSFPGHNPDGTPIEGYGDPSNDPWQYATFNNAGTRPMSERIPGGAGQSTQIGGSGAGIGGDIGGALSKVGGALGKNGPLIQLGAGVASNLVGAHMQSSAANKQNQVLEENRQRMYAMQDEEQKRRNALIQQLLPLMGRDMNNGQIGSLVGSYGAPNRG